MKPPVFRPPKLAEWLLERALDADERLWIPGDMTEEFNRRYKKHGRTAAVWWYWSTVGLGLPGFLIRAVGEGGFMIYHYIRIALRNMWKFRTYTAINIGGLAFAMACCLLIMLFVRDEFSYDRFHTDADRIFRLAVREDYGEDRVHHNTITPLPLGPVFKSEYPEVDGMVRIAAITDLIQRGERMFSERIHMVESSFLDVFDFDLIRSRSENPLAQRDAILLTPAMVEKYFSDEDPVGRPLSIRMGGTFVDYTVAGIVRDAPTNSSIQYDFLMSFDNGRLRWSPRLYDAYFNVIPETYIRLKDAAMVDGLQSKVVALGERIMGNNEGVYEIQIQPLSDIHLNTYYPAGLEPISDPQLSYILAAIALLILIIACINFITLAVSRATDRAKEVGIRKVVGAVRNQLIRQFWSETLLMSVAAMVLALLLAHVLLPIFNQLSGKPLTLSYDGLMVALIGLVLILTGCLAGGYPALMMSGFSPNEALKGILHGASAGGFRRLLTVVQFTMSIVLMIGALMMQQQLGYIRSKPLGYEKDHVVVLPTGQSQAEALTLLERFRAELSGHRAVHQITAARCAFGEGWLWLGYHDNDNNYRSFNFNIVEYDFLTAMGLELSQGRDFSRDMPSDFKEAILVNETLVAQYGWDEPVGQQLPGRFGPHRVVGVVKDFHYFSLHTPVEPLVMMLDFENIRAGASDLEFRSGALGAAVSNAPGGKLILRIDSNDIPGTMALLETIWKKTAPALPFDYFFIDDAVDRQYRQEERLETIVRYATVLAILIACLGLYGLVILTTGKRIKEIGIRKVMGASVSGIVVLIAKDFVRLIMAAFILAVPLSYLAVSQWLQGFAYRTEIAPGVFLLVGIMVISIAVATIGVQAIRAARGNPVDALRYE